MLNRIFVFNWSCHTRGILHYTASCTHISTQTTRPLRSFQGKHQVNCIVLVFISNIPSQLHVLCQVQANPPGVEFPRTVSKFRKRIKFCCCLLMSSIVVIMVIKVSKIMLQSAKNFHEMYKKVCCKCKVVVLSMFSLLIVLSDLKVPNRNCGTYMCQDNYSGSCKYD